MKFKELYSKLFITEKDDQPSDANTEVAHPEDMNDVEPAPLPQIGNNAQQEAAPAEGEAPSVQGGNPQTLTDYLNLCEDFAEKINNTEGNSLQILVFQLDKPASPYEGIHDRTSTDIEGAAKAVRILSEKLKNFIISAAKNKS